MPSPDDTERLFAVLLPSEIVREQAQASEDATLRGKLAATLTALATLSPAPAQMPVAAAALRERVVASVRTGGRYGIFADRIARLFDLTLDDARDYLARAERSDAWGPGPMDGVSILPVTPGARCAGALATFTRFEPGVVFPMHTHVDGEVTLVVDGGFRDGSPGGVEIWRGDELYKPPGSEHDFRVLEGGVCIAAAVAFGGIELA